MNKYILLFLLVITSGLISCTEDSDDDDDAEGNWVKFSDFEGDTRSGAVGFVIGDFAYLGLGSDGDDYLKDFWRYDSDRNFWEEMAPFPGTGRTAAVAFSIDGKGYMGTGFNTDLNTEELGDFWEYDPVTDVWSEKASFGGGPRYSAVSFSLQGKGYIGTGYDGSYLKDFWSYDPSTDTWVQAISLFGSKRESAVAFVMDGIAYVGSGRNNGQYLFDFWSFTPESDSWNDLSLNDDDDDYDEYIDALRRYDGVAFVMNDLAYITTGLQDSFLSSIVSYDPVNNRWADGYTYFEGVSRGGAVAFVINDQGYVATGRSTSQSHDDIWGFRPFEEYEEFD